MLTREENERLTRVGRGTPMGELLRRFWLPFLLTSDLAEPDGAPVRVSLLGERLVAFRDSAGRIGLIERNCAHRCADLFFGRNEDDGLRCTYHGWKYDVEGRCVDMPTEDAENSFKDNIRLTAYPVRERAGVLWTYMGPKEQVPELPELEWARVPERQRFTSWNFQQNNFVQAIDGGIDTVHSVFLHSNLDSHRRLDDWQAQGKRDGDPRAVHRVRTNPPKLFAADTDYGVMIGGKYKGKEGKDYWRYNNFMMPFYTMPPGGGSGPNKKIAHAFVPLDDDHCMRWVFTWNIAEPLSAREVAEMRAGSSVHVEFIPGTHYPARNMSNDYLIDRELQKTWTYTGIKGIGEQDFSVQEGMGPIADRTREHLGSSDIGIAAMRRRLLKAAADLQEGVPPYAALHGDVYRIRSTELMLPADAAWDDNEPLKSAMAATW
jgi:phenylpropionate dioxygenase-like ring-hydroxylating dioxygenase large terminal subunit